MKLHLNNKMGAIQIDPDVISLYAGMTAVECFGIVGMASVNMKDGLVRLLKKDSLTHGINVTVSEENTLIIEHICVIFDYLDSRAHIIEEEHDLRRVDYTAVDRLLREITVLPIV